MINKTMMLAFVLGCLILSVQSKKEKEEPKPKVCDEKFWK